MNRRDIRAAPWLIAVLFYSGLAALGYQIVWAESFGAGIGHEYPATLAVVTAFMSGLAIGALAYERFAGHLRNVRSAYAILELIIASWGAASALLIPWLNKLTVSVLGIAPSFAFHWIVSFVVVFLGLLPATTAMGATLPAVQQLVCSLTSRTRIGLLYGANTAGAMLGAVLAAFWIMPAFGLRNSLLLLAGVNCACGLVIFRVVPPVSGRAARQKDSSGTPRGVTVRLIVTGLLGIGFETVMIRALSHILESTVYTFAILLAVYLLGTALGALIYEKGKPSQRQTRKLFAGLAFSCLASGILLRWLPDIYLRLRISFGDALPAVAAAEFLSAMVAFFMPALVMGAIFATLAESALAQGRSLGWSVSLNGFGSACAPAIFGVLILPVFGLKIGLAVVVLGCASLAERTAFWLIPCCALLLPLAAAGTDLVRHSKEKIVFFLQGTLASVAVLEGTNGARVLKVNNRFQMGGSAARLAEERHADIPLLLHPAPARALFIGLGTGITFATAAKYPGLVADGVELLPEVVEAMPLFQEDPHVFEKPALRLHIADGRRFVLTSTNRYDVIVGDLFHPAQDGAGFLYTFEHFSAIRERLARNGLFCQWLPLYQMDLSTFDLIANTFHAVFPDSEIWLLRFNVDTPTIGLIGWIEPPKITVDSVEHKAAASKVLRDHLHAVALGDTLRLFGCRLGPFRQKSNVLNTDQHPLVLFRAPYATFREKDDPSARLLELIAQHSGAPMGVPVMGEREVFLARLEKYNEARDVYLHALVQENKGELKEAVNLYIESSKRSADFTSGYAQALGIATSLAGQEPATAESILRRLIEAQPDRPVARQLLERLTSPR